MSLLEWPLGGRGSGGDLEGEGLPQVSWQSSLSETWQVRRGSAKACMPLPDAPARGGFGSEAGNPGASSVPNLRCRSEAWRNLAGRWGNTQD